MAELYVSFQRVGIAQLAIVITPKCPEILEFDCREALVPAMDALGNDWHLESEVAGKVSTTWLEEMARVGLLKSVPRPPKSIFSLGAMHLP